jgi:hypothetical protein
MEEKRTNTERSLSRAWEGQRLQQELLALAYEEAWPVLRLRTGGRRAGPARTARTRAEWKPELQQANGG